jgi:CRP/FNR family transcriptional regulator
MSDFDNESAGGRKMEQALTEQWSPARLSHKKAMPEPKKRDCATCTSRVEGIFQELNPEHIALLNSTKASHGYRRGQILFTEGSPPMGLFCVASGKIKVSKNGADGNEVLIRIAKAGDVLGYRSLLSDENLNATAEVIEDSTCCFIDRAFLTQLIAEAPNVAFQLLRKLSHDLGCMETRLSDLLNKTVRQRLCHLLLSMRKTYGVKDADGTLLDIHLTRAELASMVGATPETVIRLLSEFKDSNYVQLRGKMIVITDPNSLMREAEIDT